MSGSHLHKASGFVNTQEPCPRISYHKLHEENVAAEGGKAWKAEASVGQTGNSG